MRLGLLLCSINLSCHLHLLNRDCASLTSMRLRHSELLLCSQDTTIDQRCHSWVQCTCCSRYIYRGLIAVAIVCVDSLSSSSCGSGRRGVLLGLSNLHWLVRTTCSSVTRGWRRRKTTNGLWLLMLSHLYKAQKLLHLEGALRESASRATRLAPGK